MQIEQIDRDAAADAVKAYRDQKNGNWQARIRAGECDDGEMVRAFAKHRLAHRHAAPDDAVERVDRHKAVRVGRAVNDALWENDMSNVSLDCEELEIIGRAAIAALGGSGS